MAVVIYSDNFDNDTLNALPAGWTSAYGTWSVSTSNAPSGQGLISTTKRGLNMALYTGAHAPATSIIYFEYKYSSVSAQSIIGPVIRASDDFTNAYLFNWDLANTINFFRKNGGQSAYTQIGSTTSAAAISKNTGDTIAVEVTSTGTKHEIRLWNKTSGSRPAAASFTATDDGALASGYAGFAYVGSDNPSYLPSADSFSITDPNATSNTAATAYTLSGPTTGTVGQASTSFGATLNGTLSTAVVITPSDGGAGGTFTPSAVTIAAGATTGSFTYTPASTGAKTISTANNGSLTNPAAVTLTAAAAPVVVDRLNAAVVQAPYVWKDDGASLNANAPGAYLTLGFTGTSIKLNTVALSGLNGYPVVRAFIDGLPHVDVTLASGQTSFTLASGLAAGSHTLKLAVVSFDQRDTYWTLAAAVKITSFTLDAGATVSALAKRSTNALFYGDSLIMGYLINADGSMDGTQTLAWLLAEATDAEVGQVGYGGQGYEVAGGGGVPKLPDAYAYYSFGVSRLVNGLLPVQPDDIYDMHGTNPVSGPNVVTQADVAAQITAYRAMAPNARIWMIVAPGGYGRAAKTAAVAACGDAKVFLLDAGAAYGVGLNTPGTAGEAASDGIHLYVRTNARFAAKTAALRQHLVEPRRFTITAS